jgi:hypothetical protein
MPVTMPWMGPLSAIEDRPVVAPGTRVGRYEPRR